MESLHYEEPCNREDAVLHAIGNALTWVHYGWSYDSNIKLIECKSCLWNYTGLDFEEAVMAHADHVWEQKLRLIDAYRATLVMDHRPSRVRELEDIMRLHHAKATP